MARRSRERSKGDWEGKCHRGTLLPSECFFGANALAALKADNGPLAGLDISLQRHDYDWDRPALLERLVEKLTSADAIIACGIPCCQGRICATQQMLLRAV